MGLDSFAFAKAGCEVSYIERQPELAEITSYNHEKLKAGKIHHYTGDSLHWISQQVEAFDFIYVDPARRDGAGNKVIMLQDCEPNALELISYINEKTNLLIKTSPLLDLDRAVKELQGVEKIYIVCLKNEVKEVLFLKTAQSSDDPIIEVIELSHPKPLIFEGKKSNETAAEISFSAPLKYLYEPHAGILKAGFFKSVGKEVAKIAANTHIYTSAALHTNFAGRTFEILAEGPLEKKWIQSVLPGMKANISTRNFPINADEIRKKFQLKDGGKFTLFAFRDQYTKNKVVLAKKIF
jgi:hypothetical protein